MSEQVFVDRTLETAPPAARRTMHAVTHELGHLPTGVARLVASPHLLDGSLKVNRLFEATALDPIAREVVVSADRRAELP